MSSVGIYYTCISTIIATTGSDRLPGYTSTVGVPVPLKKKKTIILSLLLFGNWIKFYSFFFSPAKSLRLYMVIAGSFRTAVRLCPMSSVIFRKTKTGHPYRKIGRADRRRFVRISVRFSDHFSASCGLCVNA